MSRQTFACIPDAKAAAQKLFKKAKYHQLSNIEIEQVASQSAKKEGQSFYRAQATFGECTSKLAPLVRAAGRFILATNVLDAEELTADEMVSKYNVGSRPLRGDKRDRAFVILRVSIPPIRAISSRSRNPRRASDERTPAAVRLFLPAYDFSFAIAQSKILKSQNPNRNNV